MRRETTLPKYTEHMDMPSQRNLGHMLIRLLARLVLLAFGGAATAIAQSDTESASSLRAKFESMRTELRSSDLQKPVRLQSIETSGNVAGNVYAILNQPFRTASPPLTNANRWCDIMILHINTKLCRNFVDGRGEMLQVHIGKKHEQSVYTWYWPPKGHLWMLLPGS